MALSQKKSVPPREQLQILILFRKSRARSRGAAHGESAIGRGSANRSVTEAKKKASAANAGSKEVLDVCYQFTRAAPKLPNLWASEGSTVYTRAASGVAAVSAYLQGAVWHSGPAHRNQRYLLLAIADNANDTGFCYPSVEYLCKKTLLSKRSVISTIGELVRDGWIAVIESNGDRRCNSYQMDLEKLEFSRPTARKTGGVVARKEGAKTAPNDIRRRRPQKVQNSGIDGCKSEPEKVQSEAELGAVSRLPIYGRTVNEPSCEPSRGRTAPEADQIHVHARSLLDRLSVVATHQIVAFAGQAIQFESRERNITLAEATVNIEERARAAEESGTPITRFWFEDAKWKEGALERACRQYEERTRNTPSVAEQRWSASDEAFRAVYADLLPRQEEQKKACVSASAEPDHTQSGGELAIAQKAWAEVCGVLRKSLGEQRYRTWIAPLRVTGLQNRVICLEAPDLAFCDVLGRELASLGSEVSLVPCFSDVVKSVAVTTVRGGPVRRAAAA